MRQRLKNLISSVEALGLDTQPIRDLLSSGEDLTKSESKVENIEREVRNHPPGSQPHQVQLMVRNIKSYTDNSTFSNKNINLNVENYIVKKEETIVKHDSGLSDMVEKLSAVADKLASSNSGSAGSSDSPEVLAKLKELSDKVDSVKLSSIPDIEEIDHNAPKMVEGFVNPIDNKEVDKLKGNIHVAPKKGRSLASSLQKLRGLKKG